MGYTFILQSKNFSILRTGGHLYFHFFSLKGWNLYLGPQRGLGKRNGNHAVYVVSVSFKEIMGFYPNVDKKITRRPTVGSGIALTGNIYSLSTFNPRRYGNLQFLTLGNDPVAMTHVTGVVYHIAFTIAGGTWGSDREKAGAPPYLPAPSTGRADLFAASRLRAVASAGGTGDMPSITYFDLCAEYGVLEGDVKIVTKIRTPTSTSVGPSAPSPSSGISPEKGSEYISKIPEYIFKVAKP